MSITFDLNEKSVLKYNEAKDFFSLYKQNSDKENLIKAVDKYYESIKLNPQQDKAYIDLAYICIVLEKYQEAYNLLKTSLTYANFNNNSLKMIKYLKENKLI
ncbi:MAG: hypothetical protein U0457_18180 [Candidatus Sericytochromatia bacterium]